LARCAALAQAGDAAYALLERIIARGLAEGRLIAQAAPEIAVSCWAMVHGLAMLAADQRLPFLPGCTDVSDSAERSLALLLRSLSRPGRLELRLAPLLITIAAICQFEQSCCLDRRPVILSIA
jgi:hypothetical protein